MSKLNALKDKIAQLKSKLGEKLDKISFVKKWNERHASTKLPDPNTLGRIFKEGNTFTRIQVIFVYLLGLTALISTGFVARKVMISFKSSAENEKLKKDYSHGLEELQRKMQARASIISVGTVMAHIYVGGGKTTVMSLDLWARVNDAAAADFAQKNELILHDRALEALNTLYNQKVNLMTEEGKDVAREKIRDSMNKAMGRGHVEEVFFYNLVIQ